MNAKHSVAAQVALVERKIEVRRERTRRHWHEIESDFQRIARRSTRWTPLAGVVVLGLVGYTLARQQGHTSAAAARPHIRAGLWASVAALASTALRLALSPQGKALWSAWRRARP